MALLNRMSLSSTLDRLNEIFFFGNQLPVKESLDAGRWIASRQGLPGAYGGTFALTEEEITKPAFLFTGEKITSRAAWRHITGEEACRSLKLLNIPIDNVQEAWEKANQGMIQRLHQNDGDQGPQGMYCCGNCSAAMWRNLNCGGLDLQEERLKAGLRELKKMRTGDGQWRTFPLYYTVLALTEMNSKAARQELAYCAPLLEKKLKRLNGEEKYDRRRKVLTEQVLSKV